MEKFLRTLFIYCDSEKVGYLNRAQIRTLILLVINLEISDNTFCRAIDDLDCMYENKIFFEEFISWFITCITYFILIVKNKKSIKGYIHAVY